MDAAHYAAFVYASVVGILADVLLAGARPVCAVETSHLTVYYATILNRQTYILKTDKLKET